MYQAIYETLKNYLNLEVIYRIEKKKLLLYPLQWKMKLFMFCVIYSIEQLLHCVSKQTTHLTA